MVFALAIVVRQIDSPVSPISNWTGLRFHQLGWGLPIRSIIAIAAPMATFTKNGISHTSVMPTIESRASRSISASMAGHRCDNATYARSSMYAPSCKNCSILHSQA
jgi:hypothetical protein